MSKSTINLNDMLAELTSPMEKTAMMADGKTDDMESKSADAGKEEKAEGKVEGSCDSKDSKESKELKEEKKETDLEKEASITKAASVLSNASPVNGLNKIAQDLADQEHKTMVKEAQVFGSVMADSFANRLAEIQTVVDASEEPTMDKTAEEHEYETMEKVATELYVNMNEGDQGLVNELCKTAAAHGTPCTPEEAFSALADEAISMGEAAALEKVAAAEVEEVMTKLGSDDHALLDGFMKTAALMGDPCTKVEAFQHMAKQAMEAGANYAINEGTQVEKVASEQVEPATLDAELVAMEKVASEMEARGDVEGVAALEKHAYEKGFEETLVKVASHTGSIGYAQTAQLMEG